MSRSQALLIVVAIFLGFTGDGRSSQWRLIRWEPVSQQPVVWDRDTNIMWQGCVAGLEGIDCSAGNVETKSFQDAIMYCAALNWGGYTNWYLPRIKELDSILDLSRVSPAVDPSVFPGSTTVAWSSTQVLCYPDGALVVDFETGDNSWMNIAGLHEVRCARKGSYRSRND